MQKCKNIDKYSDFREDLKLNFTDNFIKKYLNLEVIDDAHKFCEWFDANVEFLSCDEITEKNNWNITFKKIRIFNKYFRHYYFAFLNIHNKAF